eukprot:gene10885-12099_t
MSSTKNLKVDVEDSALAENSENVGVGENESSTKLNPRQELELKKEKLRQKEEANYTYKPQLVASSRGRSKEVKGADESRFDKLYSDALKRHLQSQWKEENGDKDLSFTPKLVSRGRSSSRGGSTSRSASKERGEPFHERLSVASISPKKAALPEKDLTFKPTISKRAQSLERKEEKDPAERLYHQNRVMKEKLLRKKSEADLKELEDCTFAPAIIGLKNGNGADREALLERMQKFEAQRAKRIEDIQKQKEESENAKLTFKPSLNIKKRSSTPTGKPEKPVYERLSAPLERPVVEDPNLTFKPKIGPIQADEDVHVRLFKDGVQKKREAEIKALAMRESLETDLTFKPSLRTGPTTRSPRSGDESTDKPFLERVSEEISSWATMKESLSKIKEEMELKDCTFSPKIINTATTKRKDDDKPLYDRLVEEAERTRKEVEKKKEEQAVKELEGVTFSPVLPRASISMAMNRSTTGEDIYTRLNHSMTESLSRTNSLLQFHNSHHIIDHDGASSVAQSSVACSTTTGGTNTAQKVNLLSEKELDKVFGRLTSATPERHRNSSGSAPAVEPKKVVLPANEVSKVVDRLSKSFTKSDLETLIEEDEQTRANLRKSIPKVPSSSLDKIFERVASRTTAATQNSTTQKVEDKSATVATPSHTKKREPSPAVKSKAVASPSSAAPSPANGTRRSTSLTPSRTATTPIKTPLVSPKPASVTPPKRTATPNKAAATSVHKAAPKDITAASPAEPASTTVKTATSVHKAAPKDVTAASPAEPASTNVKASPAPAAKAPASVSKTPAAVKTAPSNTNGAENTPPPPARAVLRGVKSPSATEVASPGPSPAVPPAPPATAVKPSTVSNPSKPAYQAPAGKEDFLAKLESSLNMLGLDINGQPLAGKSAFPVVVAMASRNPLPPAVPAAVVAVPPPAVVEETQGESEVGPETVISQTIDTEQVNEETAHLPEEEVATPIVSPLTDGFSSVLASDGSVIPDNEVVETSSEQSLSHPPQADPVEGAVSSELGPEDTTE